MASLTKESALSEDQQVSSCPETSEIEQPRPATEDSVYATGVRLYLTTASLALCIFLAGLDGTIVSTAIPTMTDEFHSLNDIGWYGSAFFLASAAFQALWGKALKHFGLKRTFIFAFSIFELGSLVCAVTPTSTGFIIGRAIAGIGASGIQAGGYTIIAFTVEASIRPLFLACIGACYALAAAVGPVIGGAFTESVSWRWCFYINLPLGGLAIALIMLCFQSPESAKPPPAPLKEKLLNLNPLGVVLILASLTCFSLFAQYAGQSHPWSSSQVIGLLIGFVLIAAAFVLEQLHSKDRALLQPRLFKLRAVTIACPFLFFLTGIYTISLYYIPLYFQSVRSVSAASSGVRTLAFVISMSLCMLLSGQVLRRAGYYKPNLVLGSILATIGCGLMYNWDLNSSTGIWIGYQILLGAGIGTALYAPLLSCQSGCEKQDTAPVTSMVCFFQALGGALFLPSAQTAFANQLAASLPSSIDPARVLSVSGAGSLSSYFQGEDLGVVRDAYMQGLRIVFLLAMACGGVCCLLSLGSEWKKINGETEKAKDQAPKDGSDKVVEEKSGQ